MKMNFTPIYPVEDIDTHGLNKVEYCGFTFTRDKKSGHFITTISLHRFQVILSLGKIDKKLAVHHIDSDKDNNSLNNFMLLTSSEHRKIHHELEYKEIKDKGIIRVCKNCSNEFIPKVYREIYCCRKCANQYKSRENYLANPEKCKASQRMFYLANPEKWKVYKRTYYKKNKEHIELKRREKIKQEKVEIALEKARRKAEKALLQQSVA